MPTSERASGVAPARGRVLFLCTGNSARSQIAESLVMHHLGERWEAYSAGSAPAGYVHPLAVEVLSEVGVSPTGLHSKSVDAFRGQSFDLVVTLCGDAEQCPVWLGGGALVHMSFSDPAAVEGSRAERLEAFRRTRDAIAREVLALLRPPEASRDLDPSLAQH
ncbi:MAG: arsenate reductase ArsC [bacterium]